ncbi:hypothetical protein EV363DRAFT_1350545 [Boletus edulis]|nr:hypothetical protein EV363DRAFT_1350545 [Boletus edulis]
MCLFEQCLEKVLPICNGEDQTPVEGLRAHKVKEAFRKYSGIQTEKELYPVFVQAANTAFLFLERLGIEDIRPAEGHTVCFHVNDPMEIQQKHQDHASRRKPDVIVVSNKDVCDKDGICSQKDLFHGVATKPLSSKKEKVFEWRDVRTFVEFKKAKNNMEPPPERYYSQPYTPPQEKYLTLDILSEPDVDALPEALVSSGVSPRPPSQEPVRRSARPHEASATINFDSNTRKRNSDHLDPAESRSKHVKPTHCEERPAIVQAGYYSAEMFAAHTARLHAFGLVVIGDVLYFWRYDRQGIVQCSGFNFIQDLPRFLVLLLAMQRFREQHWGLHPDTDPKFGPRPEFHKTTLSNEKGKNIEVTLELSDKARVPHYGLNLFSVKSDDLTYPEDAREPVVKVFWAEATRTSEPKILKRVHDIGKDNKLVERHVPDMLWYKAFKDASTAKFRERLGLKTEGARVLYIFRKLRPITELTGRDFLHAWWETVQCHLALWEKKVYRRDISPSNLMYRVDNGKIVGVLNDFDLASTQQSATRTERTGTVPFMALHLLRDLALQGHVTHAYQHDAESYIWVLIWISLRYDDGKPRKHGRPLDAWLRVDAVGCRKEKTDFLFSNADRQILVPGKGHEENWKLGNKCIGALLANVARIYLLPEGQDPFLEIDTTFMKYLSDTVGPFLAVPVVLSEAPSREPGGGPGEETSQVVDQAEVGTS